MLDQKLVFEELANPIHVAGVANIEAIEKLQKQFAPHSIFSAGEYIVMLLMIESSKTNTFCSTNDDISNKESIDISVNSVLL